MSNSSKRKLIQVNSEPSKPDLSSKRRKLNSKKPKNNRSLVQINENPIQKNTFIQNTFIQNKFTQNFENNEEITSSDDKRTNILEIGTFMKSKSLLSNTNIEIKPPKKRNQTGYKKKPNLPQQMKQKFKKHVVSSDLQPFRRSINVSEDEEDRKDDDDSMQSNLMRDDETQNQPVLDENSNEISDDCFESNTAVEYLKTLKSGIMDGIWQVGKDLYVFCRWNDEKKECRWGHYCFTERAENEPDKFDCSCPRGVLETCDHVWMVETLIDGEEPLENGLYIPVLCFLSLQLNCCNFCLVCLEKRNYLCDK